MINIEKPEDLLSVALKNILSYRNDKEYLDLVKSFNKSVLIELEKFYPVLVSFKDNNIAFKIGKNLKDYDLKVKMDLHTLLDLAYERIGVIKAFLTRKIKIKGMYKLGSILRFQKIFLDTLKMVAADPNQYYFKMNQNTR
ncbi:MAG: hypothetical protein GF317_03210 [Candidatus Lokiarchaeota archaeon]|nr:hypothetical protein [Candidatus Lokiarchaeota archaeon]MBD3198917.1 hypothetical protein [Candidatus Lokiarchaeota archaeon]